MEATDLMIGDWVSYGNAYGKVWCLDEASDLVGLDLPDNMSTQDAHFEDIFPIPLTPEILEKNQFASEAYGNRTTYWTGGKFALVHFADTDTYSHNDIEMRYVHELQNTLRLCGIDERIELQ